MRPPVDGSLIALLRSRLPEFDNHYLDLLDIYGEDLTPEVVLMELADYVANLVVGGRGEGTLERCFGALDELASSGEAGAELLAFSFLNELPVTTRDAASVYFGPVAADLAQRLDDGTIEEFLAGAGGAVSPAGGGSGIDPVSP